MRELAPDKGREGAARRLTRAEQEHRVRDMSIRVKMYNSDGSYVDGSMEIFADLTELKEQLEQSADPQYIKNVMDGLADGQSVTVDNIPGFYHDVYESL